MQKYVCLQTWKIEHLWTSEWTEKLKGKGDVTLWYGEEHEMCSCPPITITRKQVIRIIMHTISYEMFFFYKCTYADKACQSCYLVNLKHVNYERTRTNRKWTMVQKKLPVITSRKKWKSRTKTTCTVYVWESCRLFSLTHPFPFLLCFACWK